MTSLAGKVAFVTGASRGLGREVVSALAAAGARVVAVGRDRGALAETVASAGRLAVPVTADVRVPADVEAAVGEAVARFGALDLVVNAAGVLRHGAVDELDEHDWDLLFDTNVKGCYLVTKHAAPALRAGGGGAIVNVASVYAFAANAGTAAYAASKAAVVALTRISALDLIDDGIRVNGVAPGSMETPMVLAATGGHSALKAAGRLHPIGRLVEPAEVARLILFLLSDDASAIVGCTYTIDGGRLAKLGAAG